MNGYASNRLSRELGRMRFKRKRARGGAAPFFRLDLIWLGSFDSDYLLILNHGAKLLAEFGSVLVPVNGTCMQHRQFQNLVFGPRNGN